MKRATLAIVAALLTLLVALTPVDAHAVPKKWRNAPSVTQSGVTYRYRDKVAVVTKVPNRKEVTIPAFIKVNGKRYQVRAIWDDALWGAKKLRKLTIHADLESIEDPAIWDRRPRIKVVATVPGVYSWLKRTGVSVTRK